MFLNNDPGADLLFTAAVLCFVALITHYVIQRWLGKPIRHDRALRSVPPRERMMGSE